MENDSVCCQRKQIAGQRETSGAAATCPLSPASRLARLLFVASPPERVLLSHPLSGCLLSPPLLRHCHHRLRTVVRLLLQSVAPFASLSCHCTPHRLVVAAVRPSSYSVSEEMTTGRPVAAPSRSARHDGRLTRCPPRPRHGCRFTAAPASARQCRS